MKVRVQNINKNNSEKNITRLGLLQKLSRRQRKYIIYTQQTKTIRSL